MQHKGMTSPLLGEPWEDHDKHAMVGVRVWCTGLHVMAGGIDEDGEEIPFETPYASESETDPRWAALTSLTSTQQKN